MKYIIACCLLVCSQFSAFAQTGLEHSKTQIYLVRHAEKEGGQDPVLTPAGKERAGDLYRTLKDKNIKRIYATQYKRTQMTGDTLRILQNIPMEIYPAADTTAAELIKKIKLNNDKNKTILIIGHSNTVSSLIRHLGVEDFAIKELSEAEFDNLFLIKYKRSGPKVAVSKYGKRSIPNAMKTLQ